MVEPLRHWIPSAAALVLSAVACGPAVDSPGASSSGDTTSTGASTSTNTATTVAAGSSSSSSTSADESSSTGEPWTYPSGHSSTSMSCNNGSASVLIELFDEVPEDCVPDPGIDDGFVLLGVQGWDGNAGTFELGPGGTGVASIGLVPTPSDEGSGWITLEVDAPWSPTSVTFDVTVGTGSAAGSAELAACFGGEPVDPCID